MLGPMQILVSSNMLEHLRISMAGLFQFIGRVKKANKKNMLLGKGGTAASRAFGARGGRRAYLGGLLPPESPALFSCFILFLIFVAR